MTDKEKLRLILLEEWDSEPSQLQVNITLNPDLQRIEKAMQRAFDMGMATGKLMAKPRIYWNGPPKY